MNKAVVYWPIVTVATLVRTGGACLFLWLITLTTTFAQNDRTVFNQTIDEFNRITIRYVLAADGEKPEAPELARKLAEPAYEYDLKQLQADIQKIYGSNSRTEKLSNLIHKQKENFVEGKPLAQQFATVIQLIRDDRRGKPYLADLERDLVEVREEALKDAVAGAAVPGGVTSDNQVQRLQAQVDNLQQQLNHLSNPTAMPATGVPLYVLILLALVGALSMLNFWLLWQWKNRRRRSSSGSSSAETVDSHHQQTNESIRKIRESVANLERRVTNLNEQWKRDLDEVRRESRKSSDKILLSAKEKPVPATVANSPRTTTQPSRTSGVVDTPGGAKPDRLDSSVSGNTRSGVPVTKPIIEAGTTVDLEVKQPSPTPEPEKPRYTKKYADYPKENGFAMAQLSDHSDRRSIYEISISPDQEQATFSIVNDPAIHEYAIQNRERLLRDACDFEISSSKHTRIEVLEPGTLQMDGNAWQIRSKAKIKFV